MRWFQRQFKVILAGRGSRQEWLSFVIPLALFTAILISVGPYLQHFSYLALEGSEAPTSAEAVHARGAASLPSLSGWTTGFLYWPFLLAGLVAAIVAAHGAKPRQISIYLALSLIPLLTIIDISLSWSVIQSWEDFLKNMLANIVGSALVGAACAVSLWLYEIVSVSLSNELFRRYLAAVSLPLSAVFLIVTLYYGLLFFVQPTVESFDLTTRAAFRGFYSPYHEETIEATEQPQEPEEERRVFSLLPDRGTGGAASVTFPSGQLSSEWSAAGRELQFVAEIFLVADCSDFEAASRVISRSPYIHRTNVWRLQISVNEGPTLFETGEQRHSSFSLRFNGPTFYWFVPNDDGAARIRHYMTERDALTARLAGASAFYIRAPQMSSDGGASRPAARSFRLRINNDVSDVRFPASTTFDLTRRLRCRAVEPRAQGVTNQRTPVALAGVFVRLVPVERQVSVVRMFESQLQLTGGAGWATIEGVPLTSLQEELIGVTDFMAVASTGARLGAAGHQIEFTETDNLTIVGHVRAKFTPSGGARFTGRARLLWRNNELLNRTRWERLSTELQVAVFAWLGAMLLGFLRLLKPVFARLKSDDELRL